LQNVSTFVNSSDFEYKLPSYLAAKARNLRHRPVLSRVKLLADTEELVVPGSTHHSTRHEEARNSYDLSAKKGAGKGANSASKRFLTALTARMQETILMDGVHLYGEFSIDDKLGRE